MRFTGYNLISILLLFLPQFAAICANLGKKGSKRLSSTQRAIIRFRWEDMGKNHPNLLTWEVEIPQSSHLCYVWIKESLFLIWSHSSLKVLTYFIRVIFFTGKGDKKYSWRWYFLQERWEDYGISGEGFPVLSLITKLCLFYRIKSLNLLTYG